MHKHYIFYDLETNGLDYYTTGIMQISMIDTRGNVLLNQYAYPFNNKIEGTEIHGIDKQKLEYNNAINAQDLCVLIKNRLRENYGRDDVYLIAYNNFGYDQIILENNFKVCNIKVPNNWYFVDLCPIIKELYPNIKPNYKLGTIFANICGNDDIVNFHCALADTQCMYKIFKNIENIPGLYDYLFPKYTRALLQSDDINRSPISTLNGYNKNINFEMKNIYTIGDLYDVYMGCYYDNKDFEVLLRNKFNMYSNYYISNIIKQMEVIRYFSTIQLNTHHSLPSF
jgi:DNA polymerase III alpha subunit (gram-positive type)